MKKIFVLSIAAASLLLTSCGSSENTVSTDYQYEQWKRAQQEQTKQEPIQQKRPGRKLREEVRSVKMAEEKSDRLRAWGTATSYVEKAAVEEARRMARNELAMMMKVAVEGAAQDYAMNAQQNMKVSAETLAESIISQFVAEEVLNSDEICHDIYDLDDGTIQVYCCYEIRDSQDDFNKKLSNTLDREALIGIQYDRERFIQKMSDGLKEYKEKQANKED